MAFFIWFLGTKHNGEPSSQLNTGLLSLVLFFLGQGKAFTDMLQRKQLLDQLLFSVAPA